MKSNITPPHVSNILTVAAFAAAAHIPLQAGAQSQNLYFNDISDNNSSYISNPANWFTNPEKTERFDGTLDGTHDAYISGGGATPVKVAANQKPVFDSLSYSETDTSAGGQFMVSGNDSVLRTSGDFVTSFTLLNDSSVTTGNQITRRINMWNKSSVQIGGDWIINSNRNGSKNYLSLMIDDSEGTPDEVRFQVDGNVVSAGASTLIFTTNNKNFTVGGSMNLNGSQWNILRDNSRSDTFIRSVGGISGSARLNITKESWGSVESRTVNLVLTNGSAFDLATSFASPENNDDKLNITMTASDARNGRQALRFDSIGSSSYWCNGMQVFDANINNVEVNIGRLDIGMHGGMKGANLGIYGYSGNAADAVFSAAGLSSGQEIGRVQFDSMTFYEGTIVFDLGEVDCDFIQINGGVRKDAPNSQITFDMNITKDDLQMYLEALGAETMEWDLMSFKTDDSDFALTDIILKTQAGIDGELSFLADDSSGLTTVQLSLGVIPEPAAIAAIIGAIALSLAAWHRRR